MLPNELIIMMGNPPISALEDDLHGCLNRLPGKIPKDLERLEMTERVFGQMSDSFFHKRSIMFPISVQTTRHSS